MDFVLFGGPIASQISKMNVCKSLFSFLLARFGLPDPYRPRKAATLKTNVWCQLPKYQATMVQLIYLLSSIVQKSIALIQDMQAAMKVPGLHLPGHSISVVWACKL